MMNMEDGDRDGGDDEGYDRLCHLVDQAHWKHLFHVNSFSLKHLLHHLHDLTWGQFWGHPGCWSPGLGPGEWQFFVRVISSWSVSVQPLLSLLWSILTSLLPIQCPIGRLSPSNIWSCHPFHYLPHHWHQWYLLENLSIRWKLRRKKRFPDSFLMFSQIKFLTSCTAHANLRKASPGAHQ